MTGILRYFGTFDGYFGQELEGGPQSRIGGLMDLPQPHREPFERMMANPAVHHRLNWMYAKPKFYIDPTLIDL